MESLLQGMATNARTQNKDVSRCGVTLLEYWAWSL
jgi:hypothetical protein